MGRKKVIKLTEKDYEAIEKLSSRGKTMAYIADAVGVSRSWLFDERDKDPLLKDALKKGKRGANENAQASLYDRAVGYVYEEKTYEHLIDPETGQKLTERPILKKIVKKLIQSDTALIFYLKKNWPDKYGDHVKDDDETEIVDFETRLINEDDLGE